MLQRLAEQRPWKVRGSGLIGAQGALWVFGRGAKATLGGREEGAGNLGIVLEPALLAAQ
ncbi:hypothetical protein D3C80_2105610 [compost metagenome]